MPKKIKKNIKEDIDEKIKKGICPECGGKIIDDTIHSQKYCSTCGQIYEEVPIDYGQEWRNFENEDRKRSGGIIKYSKQNKGMSTEIKAPSADIMGVPLPTKIRIKFARLRKFHYRTRLGGTANRNIYVAVQEINRICDILNIPKNIKEDTSYIYTIATERGISKGLSIEGMIVTTLFMVAKEYNFPLTLRAMKEKCKVDTKMLSKYKKILKPIIIEKFKEEPRKILDPETYLEKIASDTGIPPNVVEDAKKILNIAKEKKLTSGRNPVSFAVAALYICCKKNNIKFSISSTPDASYGTVNKRINELNKIINS